MSAKSVEGFGDDKGYDMSKKHMSVHIFATIHVLSVVVVVDFGTT